MIVRTLFGLLLWSFFDLSMGRENPLIKFNKHDIESKVIGGTDAPPGRYPYMVSLRDYKNRHSCGGSILSRRTILTAAHCIIGEPLSNMFVQTGSTMLDQGGIKYASSRLIPHPEYDEFSTRNDIGLIILEEEIVFDNFTQPIDLETEEISAGTIVTLTGWGTTSYPGTIPNNLQQLDMRVITEQQCRDAYADINPVFDTNICTSNGFGQSGCHYDSGGPIAKDGKVIGIVNWGFACAVGYPDVYSKVSKYIDWIGANKD